MRIVMFTNTYLPFVSGVARSVETFSDDLWMLGHEVHVVCPTFKGATQSTERVFRVPAIQNFNGSDFSVRIPLPGAISQHLHKFNPDLIHAHHPFLLGDTALRAARELGRPLVFTHHTMYEDYTHYVPGNQERLRQFVVRLSIDYANFCDHVIAPSESVAALLHGRGVESPITVIPTGIDLAVFSSGNGRAIREELGISPNCKVIGHLGRLAPEKNLEYLAEAITHYLCHKAGADSCCLMVGSGPSEEPNDSYSWVMFSAAMIPLLVLSKCVAGSRIKASLADPAKSDTQLPCQRPGWPADFDIADLSKMSHQRPTPSGIRARTGR